MTRARVSTGSRYSRPSSYRFLLPVLGFTLLGAQAPQADSGHAVVPPAVDTQRAADPALEALTREVASELRCPVCQGLSINDSPSELAVQMKGVIRDQLAAGRTPEQVKAYFIARYGEWVLLEPEPSGINLLVYILPFAALAGGAALIVLAVRRWLSRSSGPLLVAASPVAGDDDLDARS